MKNIFLNGLFYLFLLFGAFIFQNCSSPTAIEETEFKFENPKPFSEQVDSIQVIVQYGDNEVTLYEGVRGDDGFEGPYTAVVRDYQGEDLSFIIYTFDDEGTLMDSQEYEYTVSNGALDPYAVAYFNQDTLNVNLTDEPMELSWFYFPEDATGEVSFTSSHPEIVEVDSDGHAEWFQSGETQIILEYIETEKKDTLIIIVHPESDPTEKLDSVRLSLDTLKLFLGTDAETLEYQIFPDTATPTLLWVINNASVATITDKGEVTPLNVGNAWITLFAAGEGVVKDSLYLQVRDTSEVEEVFWVTDTLSISINEGDSTFIDLKDSIINTSSLEHSIKALELSANGQLKDGVYSFSAGLRDSGLHVDLISVTAGDLRDTLVVLVNVNPTYVTLEFSSENGSISANPALDSYRLGDTITLSPEPENGYSFTSWQGDAEGAMNPLTLVMDDNKNISADFTLTTIQECIPLESGSSINLALQNVYTSPLHKGTLCPEDGGVFDENTLKINGKVKFLIR